MRTIKVQPLSRESFAPFGAYANLIEPSGAHIGAPPLQFFRDSIQQTLGAATSVSYSTCRVEPRPLVIDVLEYHSHTGEAILPLENDVIVQVGSATHPNDPPSPDRIEAFEVPQGTMLCIRPGVWHHGPFAMHGKPAHILIALPERAYANDCVVVKLAHAQRIEVASR